MRFRPIECVGRGEVACDGRDQNVCDGRQNEKQDQHYFPAGFSDTGGSAQEKYQQPGNKKMYRNENGEYPEESPNPDVGYCGS